MKSKYLAFLLAAAMLCGAATSCGDSDEESGSSSRKSSRSTSSSKVTDEDATDEDETEEEESTEDGIEATTRKIEKATGSQRETAPSASESTTEAPKKPAQKYTGKLTDLTGKYTSEVMELLGDGMQLESDGLPGYYRIFNYDVIPGADFYFNDHTCDDIYDGEAGLGKRKPEIIEKLRKEFSKIEKITCDSGQIDEFRPGMTYSDCMKIIGAFPLRGSNNGETVCGGPLSVAYDYLHENNNCIVSLHFKLEGELDRALNEGKFVVGNCGDISPNEALSFNPKLQRIEIKHAPACTNPNANVTCTSKLADITSNGKRYTYGPENVIDGDFNTCWCEGASDVGINQGITWQSPSFMKVGYITVYGGLLSSQESFFKNCRPTKMIVAPQGLISEYYIPTNFSRKYKRAIPVGYTDGIASSFDIIITEVDSSGAEYSDTCISEIRFNVVDSSY